MPLSRRSFVAQMLAAPLAGVYANAARAAAPSKITRIETVYWKSRDDAPFWPHWTWVKIDTDAGVSGIGETYPRNPAEAAAVHAAAQIAAGPRPARHRADLGRPLPHLRFPDGRRRRNPRARAPSTWRCGICSGKVLNAPVYRLIGGKANPRVRLYNTCFPYKYDFNREPEKIMRELIDTRGIKAIKIWPFDGAAARNQNQFITPQDIDEALQPVKKLRDTFGIGNRDRHRVPRAMERHLGHPHRPRAGALPAHVAGRHADAGQLPAVSRSGGGHQPALIAGRAHGGQNAIRAIAGIAHRQIRDVRRHLVRRA